MGNNKKVYLLYNWPCEDDHWIPIKLRARGYDVTIVDIPKNEKIIRSSKFFRIYNVFLSFKLSINRAKNANDDDIIISMTSTPGIAAALVLRLLNRKSKTKIIALNLLAHWSNSYNIGEIMRDWFYKSAFKYPYLCTTVNVKKDIELYSNKFNISQDKIHLLPDAIENMVLSPEEFSTNGYVFAGGMSERDWDCVIECAKKMKNTQFVVVANRHDWPLQQSKLNNLQVYHDVTPQKFNELLHHSKVVVLPLKTKGTAGLMVLFEALRSNKMIISTDTVAIRNFIDPKHYNDVLYPIHDYEVLSKKINEVFDMNADTYNCCVKDLMDYVYNNYSEDKYLDRLEVIID